MRSLERSKVDVSHYGVTLRRRLREEKDPDSLQLADGDAAARSGEPTLAVELSAQLRDEPARVTRVVTFRLPRSSHAARVTMYVSVFHSSTETSLTSLT